MTASTSPNRDNSKAALLARLENADHTPAHQKAEISDLPRWVKTALVLQAVDGLTYKEAAERFKKTGGTLSNYAKSPAAKLWLASLKTFIEDPVAMAKAYLSANALSVTLERFIFLQAAIDAGDYDTGDRIARDLQDRMGIVAKKTETGAISVKIQLGASALDVPAIEAEWEEVKEDARDE